MALRVGYFLAGTLCGVLLGTAIVVSRAAPAAQSDPPQSTAADATSGTTQPLPPPHEFVLGFGELHEQLGEDVMGSPVEDEHAASDADAVQRTTLGLAVWRRGAAPAFTDGYHRWSLDMAGLAAASSPLIGNLARADCIIAAESGGADVPNRQGSGATGPGQYFPSTWIHHVALYRQATGYQGSLSLHSLADVRRVMAWILAAMPSSRSAWSVGGC